ncbi:MAG TPA: TatD family deoxyribonuclease [Firmicutes bacterium]|mgnify:CR=1 FL=1|nr:TatD family deoxyribonuclease [Bacillota bacterium]
MAIDTHCHLTLRFEKHEIAGVLARAFKAGVNGVLLVGYDPKHYQAVSEIIAAFGSGGSTIPAIAATVGIHPHEADNYAPSDVEFFRDEVKKPEVVAIGETGLDFFRDYSDRKSQEELFRAQMKIASETGTQLVIHSRSAFSRTIAILDEFDLPDPPGVFHCYGYGREEVELVQDMGFFISFAGNLTLKNEDELKHVCRVVQQDRILVETDSPFMVPQIARNRRVRRCEPEHVIETARKVAELRNLPYEQMEKILAENTLACFPKLKKINSWYKPDGESGEVIS